MKFDVIIIGAGSAGMQVATALQKAGRKTAVIGLGRSINEVEVRPYERLGGTLLIGDSVSEGLFEDGRLKAVRTANLGAYPLEAERFVLATGKFLGGGLVADMERVYEPLFGLDVAWDEDRSRWFDADFGAPQPFLSFGLKTDAQSRPSLGGRTVENLYACGEILAGVSAVDGREAIAASAAKVLSILTEEGHAEA
jgi:anaerobic glycerol-3-phosphate dehydrogenase B subunit